jgi:small nuclear ribonucleoprotein (snRNP)-like protein
VALIYWQLFYSFFKTLVDQRVTVELKNDLAITGVLKSVDQFLNIKLDDIQVIDEERYPHMVKESRPFPFLDSFSVFYRPLLRIALFVVL